MKFVILFLLLFLPACALFAPQSEVMKLQTKIDKVLEKNPVYVSSQYCVLADKGEVIKTECLPEAIVSQNENSIVVDVCNENNCTKTEHAVVSIPKKQDLAVVDNSMVVRAMTCGLMYEHYELNKTRYEVVESKDFQKIFEFSLEDCKKHDKLLRTMCIQCIAATQKDPSICHEITLSGIWSSPTDECLVVVAQVSNNIQGCDEIKDEELKEFCINEITGGN